MLSRLRKLTNYAYRHLMTRDILPDGVSTLARGHFGIAELNAEAKKNNYYV